jgi:hypothetical protein
MSWRRHIKWTPKYVPPHEDGKLSKSTKTFPKTTPVMLQRNTSVKYLLKFLLKYTGLFISPSGISDPCGTVAGMVTPKGSISTEGESLQVSVLPYRCSICPPLVTRQISILFQSSSCDTRCNALITGLTSALWGQRCWSFYFCWMLCR